MAAAMAAVPPRAGNAPRGRGSPGENQRTARPTSATQATRTHIPQSSVAGLRRGRDDGHVVGTMNLCPRGAAAPERRMLVFGPGWDS
jgi:hypothetical protein